VTTWHASIPVAEVFDTVDEDLTEDGITASVDLHVAANRRHVVARDLLVGRKLWPYLPPDISPAISRIKIKLFPSALRSEGQGIVYDMATLSCTFTTDIKDALSEELVPSVRFVKQDHRGYYWREPNADPEINEPGDPITEEEAPGRQEFGMVLVRTHYDVLRENMPTNWKAFVGKVHNAPYTSLLLKDTYAEGTLRFDAPKISRTVRTDNRVQLNLTTRWSYKEQGWNKFYRPASDTYEPILKVDPALAADADPVYVRHENFPEANLSPVFFNPA